jgi:hypothetical protein
MNQHPALRPLFLVLAVLLMVLAAAPAMAQQAPAAAAVSAAASAAPAATADFLASLAAGPAVTPAPDLLATGCTSTSQCPTGQLCCLACGASDCTRRLCTRPINGHCPFYP